MSLRKFLARPATVGAVILSYFGLAGVGLVGHEDAASKADIAALCKVVRDVHTNAVFRYHSEQQRVVQTQDFLADPKVKHDALYDRVKANLPNALNDLKAAKQGAQSTTVPATCKL